MRIDLRQRTYFEKNGFKIDPCEGLPPLYIQTSMKSNFYPSPDWWKNFEYLKERNRGYEYQEDLFTPGVFEVSMKEGDCVIFRASLDSDANASKKMKGEWEKEMLRLSSIRNRYLDENSDYPSLTTLKCSAHQYVVVDRKKHVGIIAGYHWFNEWGRDTMIALPGIMLSTGMDDLALRVLSDYAHYEKNGLLPNFLSDTGHAYNSIDAPLFYFWAIKQYLDHTQNKKAVRKQLVPTMENIVRAFLEKRVPFAYVGDDGLLYAGNDTTQLTWMDATAFGRPVTSRHGAAVEINALWYHALSFLVNEFSDDIDHALLIAIHKMKEAFESNFEKTFWSPETQSLCDVYRNPDDRDTSIRPNQLFAIGLPYACVSEERSRVILETVAKHLVTPYGLRTLSPDHSNYRAQYNGDQNNRDQAYHQGTVWPWLIGIYGDALWHHSSKKEDVIEYMTRTFKHVFDEHATRYGLFHISEIFSPNPPYSAKGCIAQAWSVGEIIRILDRFRRYHKGSLT